MAMTEAGDGPIRVGLGDDHQLIRGGLRRALEWDGDIKVVGEADSCGEAVRVIQHVTPDVLITDVGLPDGDGIALAARVRAANQRMGIVVLTIYAGDDQVFAALNAGAS